jgi:hypothetical protein
MSELPPPDQYGIVRHPVTGLFITTAGKPRGAIERPETRNRKAMRAALAMDGHYRSLVALGKMAQENMGVAIARGNPIASTWLLDKVVGRLPEAPLQIAVEGADFTTIDGVLATAALIMGEMAAGRLPLAQAEKFLNTCRTYGQLRMGEEIAKLEALLKETEDAHTRGTAAPPVTQLEADQVPTWGRLQETLTPVQPTPKPYTNGHDVLAKPHTNGHDPDPPDPDPEAELRKRLLE